MNWLKEPTPDEYAEAIGGTLFDYKTSGYNYWRLLAKTPSRFSHMINAGRLALSLELKANKEGYRFEIGYFLGVISVNGMISNKRIPISQKSLIREMSKCYRRDRSLPGVPAVQIRATAERGIEKAGYPAEEAIERFCYELGLGSDSTQEMKLGVGVVVAAFDHDFGQHSIAFRLKESKRNADSWNNELQGYTGSD